MGAQAYTCACNTFRLLFVPLAFPSLAICLFFFSLYIGSNSILLRSCFPDRTERHSYEPWNAHPGFFLQTAHVPLTGQCKWTMMTSPHSQKRGRLSALPSQHQRLTDLK